MDIDVAAHTKNQIGENSLWNRFDGALYWCDLRNGILFRYDPEHDRHERVYETDYIGGFTVQADGSLLLFRQDGTVTLWREDGETVHRSLSLPEEDDDSVFNDVWADPEGRVFVGVRYENDRPGTLYRLDTDGTLSRVVDGIDNPNGIGFAPDFETLYLTDSGPTDPRILQYSYDRSTGRLTDERVFCRVEGDTDQGVPDGLTVDAAGGVYSARAHGSTVVRYDSTGTVTGRIDLPVEFVTSVAFGGTDDCTLFVTTGRENGGSTPAEFAGALFSGRSEVPGVPTHVSTVEFQQ